ncbi:MAG TPA: P-loop NTPase [Thermoanaerobaculia bacterium]|nr:P-loop NTPase [Thermoanaerobaculia bacterium]
MPRAKDTQATLLIPSQAILTQALGEFAQTVTTEPNLVSFRLRIEDTLEDLFRQLPIEQRFPLAIAIFLKGERERRILFYAIFSPRERQEEVNLRLLPLVGQAYPKDDVLELSEKARSPLLIIRKGSNIDTPGYRAHLYSVTSIRRNQDSNNTQDGVFYEPLTEDAPLIVPAEEEGQRFFDRMVVHSLELPWPFSQDRLGVATVFSLSFQRDSELDVLYTCQQCALGIVVAHAFLESALRLTSLPNFNVLIEDIIVRSWLRVIDRYLDPDSSVGRDDSGYLLSDLLSKVAPLWKDFPFAFRAVCRQIVQRFPASLDRDPFRELDLETIPLLALGGFSSPTTSSAILALQSRIVDFLLTRIQKALKERAPRAVGDMIQCLAEFIEGSEARIIQELLPLLDRLAELEPERRELLNLIISSLACSDLKSSDRQLLWSTLGSLLRREESQELRSSYGACALTLGTRNRKEAKEIATAITEWNLAERTTLILTEQVENKLRRPTVSAHKKKRARVIAVLSQKGGVGKSTIALAAGCNLGRKGKACLVEMDFGGPSFHHYTSIAGGPFLNHFWRDVSKSQRCRILFNEHVLPGLPKLSFPYGELSVWPASSAWEEQISSTSARGGFSAERESEEDRLDALLSLLSPHFDTIILDTSAEIRDLSRTISESIRAWEGLALLVASPFSPSLGPLLENYWRLIADEKTQAAVIINKVRAIDAQSVCSAQSLHDYITTHSDAALSMFGLSIHSAALLRAGLTGRLPVVPVESSEKVERAARLKNPGELLESFAGPEFRALAEVVQKGAPR